jgi:hypothetical protein
VILSMDPLHGLAVGPGLKSTKPNFCNSTPGKSHNRKLAVRELHLSGTAFIGSW